MSFGLTINGKHTSEFGLLMEHMYIPQPEPNLTRIVIPGMSGSLDVSEALGGLTYSDRAGLEFTFSVLDDGYGVWADVYSKISMWVHGRSCKVVLDNDASYYYMCRLNVDSTKSDEVMSTIVLSGTAEPFKYDLCASDEPWKWDPFNFRNGVIRNLSDIVIEGESQVLIYQGGFDTVPEFIVKQSNGLKLVLADREYDLPVGAHRFPSLRIGSEETNLAFSGNGKLSIKYRGAYL